MMMMIDRIRLPGLRPRGEEGRLRDADGRAQQVRLHDHILSYRCGHRGTAGPRRSRDRGKVEGEDPEEVEPDHAVMERMGTG